MATAVAVSLPTFFLFGCLFVFFFGEANKRKYSGCLLEVVLARIEPQGGSPHKRGPNTFRGQPIYFFKYNSEILTATWLPPQYEKRQVLKFILWTYVNPLEGLFLMMIKLVGNTIIYGNVMGTQRKYFKGR